jgi:hypothetical protein
VYILELVLYKFGGQRMAVRDRIDKVRAHFPSVEEIFESDLYIILQAKLRDPLSDYDREMLRGWNTRPNGFISEFGCKAESSIMRSEQYREQKGWY